MFFSKKDCNFFLVVCADVLFFAGAFYLAHLIRYDLIMSSGTWHNFHWSLPLVVLIKLSFFYFFDCYRGMWRYTSITDLLNIMKAAVSSTLLIVFILLLSNRFEGFSRSVFIIDLLLTVFFIAGFRLAVRFYFEGGEETHPAESFLKRMLNGLQSRGTEQKKLLIYGAGDCGEKMYREIRDNGRLQYSVVGFLDDDPAKIGKKIHGVPVYGAADQLGLIAGRVKAEEVLIALPSVRSEEMRRIIASCKAGGLQFKTVPGMGELINGRVTFNSIREVAYRDLLGRESVRLDEEAIGESLRGQCVMVTGAGGSIGSELCRQICKYRPRKLVLFERGENLLYHIDLELRDNFPDIELVPLLADIQDRRQVERTFAAVQPQIVFHAAAYKHVPMLESQPWNPVQNNILGTLNLVNAAKQYGGKRFVFVSTDKAVRPTNVMGTSKRVSEILVQNQNGSDPGAEPRFVSVRFGNVLGSAGSVVPLFKRQIDRGGPITVTHPEASRYFMTISEACQLILQAGAMGRGGEIFVLDMGRPVRIVDMARDLIRLSGLEPDTDIRIEYTGLRPGEKLSEELITEGEDIQPTSHEKILVLKGAACELSGLQDQIAGLAEAAARQDADGIRRLLQEIVPDCRKGPQE